MRGMECHGMCVAWYYFSFSFEKCGVLGGCYFGVVVAKKRKKQRKELL